MFDLSQFSLKGKVAIVTGGSRGIGQAIAYGFAKAGAKVVITSRKAQDLEATACEMKAFGGEVLVVPAHLGKIEEIQRVVDTVMAEVRPDRHSGQQRRRQPRHGLRARFRRASLGHHHEPEPERCLLHEPGCGQSHEETGRRKNHQCCFHRRLQSGTVCQRLFHFQSRCPHDDTSLCHGTGARQHSGQHHLSRTHQHQDDEFPLGTSYRRKRLKKQKDELCKHLPTCRIGDPDEIAGAAIYLASDASNYTTGTEIIIDGGLLLGTHLS